MIFPSIKIESKEDQQNDPRLSTGNRSQIKNTIGFYDINKNFDFDKSKLEVFLTNKKFISFLKITQQKI